MNLMKHMTNNRHSSLSPVGVSTFICLPVWMWVNAAGAKHILWMGYIDLLATTTLFSLLFILIQKPSNNRIKSIIMGFISFILILFSTQTIFVISNEVLIVYKKYYGVSNYSLLLNILSYGIILLLIGLFFLFKRAVVYFSSYLSTVFTILFFIFNAELIYGKLISHDSAKTLPSIKLKKVLLVLVFDELGGKELDENLFQLKTFQLVEKRSIINGRVFPPSNLTSVSLPRMLTNAAVTNAIITTTDILVFNGDRYLPIRDVGNIFETLADSQIPVSISGWALPYANTFKSKGIIFDQTPYLVTQNIGGTISKLYEINSFLNQIKPFWIKSSSYFEAKKMLKQNIPNISAIDRLSLFRSDFNKHIVHEIESNKYDVIFIHSSLPHLPRTNNTISLGEKDDYRSNLVASDNLLKTILEKLDQNSLQRPWHAIITSDHWFRQPDSKAIGKVPLYYIDSEFSGTQIRLNDGNNVQLHNIITNLINSNGSIPKTEYILKEISRYGSESVILFPP